ncbi:hypothetical protein H8356DRAFT_1673063 [Neocallimastix lanati (nom. inval.)]|jgi:hypothetical protein|uniref:Uncharacterized protein n=1 Tax=Neocallimastix californiae TaxID=1754190 RepID=A0A1Y2DEG0_9FUNG|nr:hypothetical protein H8356DRAFT_1673063 [Neocallimastix sp. JGI-2020a]ORY57660.1 hypothetical protein LY90DRAFT_506451 [Neocallimastix californiae]|eukprot:ORY57660.1 hypothetical protein LY90DRAFT_506451 [Neocallimastix californiae]
MFIKNIFCLYLNSTILKSFVILFLVPLVFSNIFYNKVEENIINQYSTVDSSMKSSSLLMFDIHKNNGHRSSTREQIRTYKLNCKNELSINYDEKTKKSTGIFSLLSLSLQNNDNNNTNNTNYKSKNILFQKLDCINKKLKNTLKQLQATTTKSFINFNFTYTQQKDFSEILSSPTTSATNTNPLCITYLKNNNPIKEQKDSKGNIDSSIPKSYIDCLKYSVNYKIKDSPSTVKNELQSSLNMNMNMNMNMNKDKDRNKNKKNTENINEKRNHETVQRKKSTLGKNTCEIQFSNTNLNSYFTLYNIPTSKSTMELNRKITSKSSSVTTTTTTTTSIESKEESQSKKGIVNETVLENKNYKKVNETESKKETIESKDQYLENFILENNLFSSPAGMALILFILYATYMF